MANRAALLTAAAVFWLAGPTPASAELIVLAGGRSLSVAGHRIEGDRIVVALRDGGEIAFDRRLVRDITPDEVPYPEPEPDAVVAAPLPAAAPAPDPRYAEVIERVSAQHGVDASLVRAVIQVESAFQPRARSPKGAVGLMQLMPQTVRQYAVRNPFDPSANIDAGIRHLRSLLNRFELPLALAAYNAGEAAVRRFGGVPPYPETRSYVARVLGLLGRRF